MSETLAEAVLRAQLDAARIERDQARREVKRLEAHGPPRYHYCLLCGALSKQPYCYAHRWAA